ncbi:hypothetical protein SKAU_G00275450 [Synaphobranchus kaupii]|uniref:CCHC-type domain-containing protein n=1 Tax=Synaphobranchus kaupii TaxID=118154 RepID=A0A9Q1F1E9_SYNKA|nr:hypothetical protein SKAU_G00275450 [Synaphobranchus kaupii]
MVYASSGQLKCFECGDVGHKRFACPHRQQAEAGSADVNTPPAASGSEAGERSATPGDKETAAQPEVSDPGAENAETPVAEQAVASSSAGAETVIRGEGTSTEPTEEITGSAQEIPSSQVAGNSKTQILRDTEQDCPTHMVAVLVRDSTIDTALRIKRQAFEEL